VHWPRIRVPIQHRSQPMHRSLALHAHSRFHALRSTFRHAMAAGREHRREGGRKPSGTGLTPVGYGGNAWIHTALAGRHGGKPTLSFVHVTRRRSWVARIPAVQRLVGAARRDEAVHTTRVARP